MDWPRVISVIGYGNTCGLVQKRTLMTYRAISSSHDVRLWWRRSQKACPTFFPLIHSSDPSVHSFAPHSSAGVKEWEWRSGVKEGGVKNNGGLQCLLLFWMFSAPVVHWSLPLAKESTHLVLWALIGIWLKGNHKNLQMPRPPGNSVWHPWCRVSRCI